MATRREKQLRYIAEKLYGDCRHTQWVLKKSGSGVEQGEQFTPCGHCGWCIAAKVLEEAADKENADHGRFVATKEE